MSISNYQSATVMVENTLKKLGESDFLLGTREPLSLMWDDLTLVLFYDETEASKRLLSVWQQTSTITVGPLFGAVSLVAESKIANTFVQVKLNPESPFNWAGFGETPFVLVYRSGWPQAFYTGPFTALDIKNFALNQAATVGYKNTTFTPFLNTNSEEKATPAPAPNPTPQPSSTAPKRTLRQ